MVNRIYLLISKYRSIIIYIFWGGVTTVINIGSFEVFVRYCAMNYQVANILAWILTVLSVYFSNKVWVFGSSYTTFRNFIKELTKFFIARLLTLIIDMVILYIGIQLLDGNDLIVKIIDNIFVIVTNYVLSKYLVFKKID